ncbi:hypothetical protein BU16DRAFT_532430 [Lophium mytilinum]|uniref:Uncharacterized protein n=1 Tax=Lophium mytilinum TaxID=390894 RepID=A0A6A6RE45_9PEZI|nr:hypothetical protein BU16DRAFT_532430 [Lophium mytilinum]
MATQNSDQPGHDDVSMDMNDADDRPSSQDSFVDLSDEPTTGRSENVEIIEGQQARQPLSPERALDELDEDADFHDDAEFDDDADFEYDISTDERLPDADEDNSQFLTFFPQWNDFPRELKQYIRRKRLSTGAIRRQLHDKAPHSNGPEFRCMTTEHSYDDISISEYMISCLVSKEFRKITREEYWHHNVLNVENCDMLSRTLTKLRLNGDPSEVRSIILRLVGGDAKELKTALLEEEGLQRLWFPMCKGYLLQAHHGYFDDVAKVSQDEIMEVLGDFIVQMRRKKGKGTFQVKYLPNFNGVLKWHEERRVIVEEERRQLQFPGHAMEAVEGYRLFQLAVG